MLDGFAHFWTARGRAALALVMLATALAGGEAWASGSLRITLQPSQAVSAGAQWRRAGQTTWRDSDTTETGVPAGSQIVEFKSAPSWAAPNSRTFIVSDGKVTTSTVYYTYLQPGSVRVGIAPPGAITAGAKWRQVGETAWRDAGTSVTGISAGTNVNIEFKPLGGTWITPANKSYQIQAAQNVETTGTYVQTGSLKVTLTPSEAVAAGAQWRREGTATWRDSGSSETGAPVGATRIELKPVSGFSTPVWPSATVAAGQLTTATAAYGPVRSGFSWGSYLGGAENDTAAGIAVNDAGEVFVTGTTYSAGWGAGDTTSTFHGTSSLYADAFVTKLTPTGGRAWSLYLGGAGHEAGRGIALDAQGGIYVAGNTASAGWLTGGYDTILDGTDGFVTRLAADGTPVWGACLGGSGTDGAAAVAVGGDGAVYVTGSTQSAGWIAGGFNTTYGGNGDAYVIKLTPGGARAWSAYLGGTQTDDGYGIAVDGQGRVFVAGSTSSTAGIATAGLGAAPKGGRDAFIAALGGDGTRLWGAYVGGAGSDDGQAIAVDGLGGVYLAGTTTAGGWASGGFDTTFDGTSNAFIAKATADGQTLAWSSYFGGAGAAYGLAVAACGAEGAVLAGMVSDGGLCTGGYNTTFGGGSDAFALKVSAAGQHAWSADLGGSSSDTAAAVAADRRGSVFVAGYTSSAGWLSGGFDTTANGKSDAFVAKLNGFGGLRMTLTPPAAVTGGAQWRPVGSQTWLASDAELTSAPSGVNLVEFKPITGWSEPPQQAVQVTAGATTATTAAYVGFGGLCVTIQPAGAVSGGAQWRRAGTTTWRDSGVTESAVPARPQVVEFKAIGGWSQPASQTVAIAEGQTTQTTGVYTPASGALKVTLTPAAAVSAGAKWRRAGGAWQNNDATETAVPTGTYALEFAPLSGWTAPTLSVTVSKDQTTAAAAAYVRQTGTLRVDITPAAVAGQARWRRAGTTLWLASGDVEPAVPTGDYQVEFMDVSGWSKPAAKPVSVAAGQLATASGQYVEMIGSLKATITPAAAVSAGAKWRYLGLMTWMDSNYTTSVPTGSYQIQFLPLNHWAEPAIQTVQVTQGQTSTINGAYVAVGYVQVDIGPVEVNADSPTATSTVAKRAKWRRVGDTAWQDGGTSMSLPAGAQTIEFLDFDTNLWIKPANAAITVTQGAGQTLTRNYTHRKGSLKVSLAPTGAKNVGARWRLENDTTWRGDGEVVSNVNTGPQRVQVCDLLWTDWAAPKMATAVVKEGLTTSITMTYTARVSDVNAAWPIRFGDIRNDKVNAVAVDKDNNLLVTGEVTTRTLSWVKGGYDTTFGGRTDGFVAKFSPTGTMLWSSYLGGTAYDRGTAITTDASGNVIVAGDTESFSWVSNGNSIPAGSEGFVVKLDPAGQLLWSSYVGGGGDDWVKGVAVDGSGNILVAGETRSSNWAAGGWDNLAATPSLKDGFVAKLTAAGALSWKTAVGGSGQDQVAGVAADSSGAAYVAGQTASDSSHTPESDKPYVERVSASGQKVWKTYLGCAASDAINAITANASGVSFVTGRTATAGWLSGGGDTTLDGTSDAFVLKLSAAGAVQWGTMLGGTNPESGTSIGLDPLGNIYAAGATSSPEWIGGGFETLYHTRSYIDTSTGLEQLTPIASEGYLVKLSATGKQLWSAILDGTKFNSATVKIAVDGGGDIAVGGEWIQATYTDGFVSRVQASGKLKVAITPQKAIDSGALWRIAGTTKWNSSVSATNPVAVAVPTGPVTVEFFTLKGWIKPDPVSVTIGYYNPNNATATTTRISGFYKEVLGVPAEMWRQY